MSIPPKPIGPPTLWQPPSPGILPRAPCGVCLFVVKGVSPDKAPEISTWCHYEMREGHVVRLGVRWVATAQQYVKHGNDPWPDESEPALVVAVLEPNLQELGLLNSLGTSASPPSAYHQDGDNVTGRVGKDGLP